MDTLAQLKKVVEDLIKTPLGIDLADRVAVAVRMDTIEDFLLWVKRYARQTKVVSAALWPWGNRGVCVLDYWVFNGRRPASLAIVPFQDLA